jgi:hypothetical protein
MVMLGRHGVGLASAGRLVIQLIRKPCNATTVAPPESPPQLIPDP